MLREMKVALLVAMPDQQNGQFSGTLPDTRPRPVKEPQERPLFKGNALPGTSGPAVNHCRRFCA
jgi:hypothetical protein